MTPLGARLPQLGALLAACPLLAALTGCAATYDEAYPPASPYEAHHRHAPAPGAWGADAPPYQWGRASFYSDRLAGRSTAGGEPYDPRAYTAAHRTLPIGTMVDVARADGRHVVVRINDRGPYTRGRVIDLSRRAAAEIGMLRDGVCDVVLRVVWVPPSRHRRL